ncbi:MAG: hypothetical protein RL477_1897, partial [Pseudomonadota bacterium]
VCQRGAPRGESHAGLPGETLAVGVERPHRRRRRGRRGGRRRRGRDGSDRPYEEMQGDARPQGTASADETGPGEAFDRPAAAPYETHVTHGEPAAVPEPASRREPERAGNGSQPVAPAAATRPVAEIATPAATEPPVETKPAGPKRKGWWNRFGGG